MEQQTLTSFRSHVLSFRNYMGNAMLNQNQRHGLRRALILFYLNTVDETGKATELFETTLQEYTRRMTMMGMEP